MSAPRPRLLKERILKLLRQFPVVGVFGARRVGKSVLAGTVDPARRFLTLDDLSALEAARSDPRGFVDGLETPVTLDEAQRGGAPLLLAIKRRVDSERRAGAFLLTGSSRLPSVRAAGDTLAGRYAQVILRPMTRAEALGAKRPNAVDALARCRSVRDVMARMRPSRSPSFAGDDILAGGYPEPALGVPDRREWFEQYVSTYVQRDVPELLQVERVPTFLRFVRAAAHATAQMLNYSRLASALGVSVDTVRRWTDVLELTFLAERVPPFWPRERARLAKTPRLFWTDAGLAAHLMGVRDWEQARRQGFDGPLLETWVHHHLRAEADAGEERPDVFFYRTRSGDEVDFVLAASDRLIPVEIKSSATLRAEDRAGLERFLARYARRAPFGVIAYRGTDTIPFGANVAAVPLGSLL